jgi:LysM repeat protein
LNFGIRLDVPPPASNPASSPPDTSAQEAAFNAAEDFEAPSVATVAPNADGSIVHTVQEGQAIWNIAAAYRVDVLELLTQNGLSDGDFVHEGDQIIVRLPSTPTPTSPPPTATRRPTLTPIAVAERSQSQDSVATSDGVIRAISESRASIQRILFGTLLLGISLILLGAIAISRASRRRPD